MPITVRAEATLWWTYSALTAADHAATHLTFVIAREAAICFLEGYGASTHIQ